MLIEHRGYTLVSLLVAMSLATGLFAASASLLATLASRHTELLLRVQAIEHIDAALMLIHSELRRSGFSGINHSGQINVNNSKPFMQALASSHNPENLPNSCITFAYDRNNNGLLDTSPYESFGFRLHNNSIEMRMAARSCQQSGWQDITEPSLLTITDMQFHLHADASLTSPVLKVALTALINGTPHHISREHVIPLENHSVAI